VEPSLFRYIWNNSRSEQLFVLGMIVTSLPFYWMSLDIPARIVNEALQGEAFRGGNTEATLFAFRLPLPDALGGTLTISDGYMFDQLGYLIALSFLFLFFVIANGAFKYVINIAKGVLAERILRRLRFELFTRMMRFRPERLRGVKPAEAASMINNELEPVGGFAGDAFISPAFLGTQALTALIFIMVQSVWLGLVALAIVLVQAFLIPYLRREQLRLGRLRQIASRHLAGRIGEMVDTSSTIQTHGLRPLSEADIGGRLGHLFDIRSRLYKRKFAVKYINNLLAQITPFFFYAIGGYFALRGSLDLGQLVAVIGAYRDLPPPIKELIDWDQRRADVSIKYEQVISQFEGPILPEHAAVEPPADTAALILDGVSLTDQRGVAQVAPLTCEIPRPAHIAIVGTPSSGRDVLARIIARQTSDYEGNVKVGDIDLANIADIDAARFLAYVPPEPQLIRGTIRDNVAIGLRRHPPEPGNVADTRWSEAERTENPLYDPAADWHDYEAAHAGGPDDLDRVIVDWLKTVGLERDLYQFGLQGRLRPDTDQDTRDRVVEARKAIRTRLVAEGLETLVEPFDPARFNTHATIGENLMFGVIAGERLADRGRASDPFFRAIIAAEALEEPLIEIGLAIAENSVEIFSDLPSGHPLFDRFSMVKSNELEEFAELVELYRSRDAAVSFPEAGRDRFMTLALDYIEPRHRLGLLTPTLERRILRARESFRRFLPGDYSRDIEFYDPERVSMAAPIRDNFLFGRVAQNIANAETRVGTFLASALDELELEDVVYTLGLDFDVGPQGRELFATQRAGISFARSLIRHPDILVFEDALRAYQPDAASQLRATIRDRCRAQTLIMTCDDIADGDTFDATIRFDGAVARVELTPRTDGDRHAARANGPSAGTETPVRDGDDAAPGRTEASNLPTAAQPLPKETQP